MIPFHNAELKQPELTLGGDPAKCNLAGDIHFEGENYKKAAEYYMKTLDYDERNAHAAFRLVEIIGSHFKAVNSGNDFVDNIFKHIGRAIDFHPILRAELEHILKCAQEWVQEKEKTIKSFRT